MKHTTAPNIELISRACRVSVTISWTEEDLFAVIPGGKNRHGHASNLHKSHASCKGTTHLSITPGADLGSRCNGSQRIAAAPAFHNRWRRLRCGSSRWGISILFFVLVVVMVMAVQRI
jgi:hypothetical protein